MREKVFTRLVPLALLFITISCVQVCSIALAEENSPPGIPSIPSGATSGTSGNYYSYSTTATDPDGDRVQYTFDWGDGNSYTTSLVNQGIAVSWFHKWTVASGSTKTFSVLARATDEHGAVSSWSSPLSVTITGPMNWYNPPPAVNNPPATPSVPSGSKLGSSGASYSYSTKATDPNGDHMKYTFDWGDGTTSVTSLVSSGALSSASHTWTVASGSTKTFNVRAKAADEHGAVSSWSSLLSVTITGPETTNNPPPAVNNPPATPSVPSGSKLGSSGVSYSYSTKATDPNGDHVKYTFNWGDGTTSVTSLVSSGASASASHSWNVASGSTKTFSVSARATDEHGAVSSWSSPLSVTITGPVGSSNNPPAQPSIPDGQITGYSGITYKYSTKATDPNGDHVKYTFDWGDGTTSVTSLVSSGATASASHQWTIAPGTKKTFNVAAKATDERGASSIWSKPSPVLIVAQKENHPPTTPYIPSGPTSGISGKSYTFSTSSTDPDGDLVKYIFDWGDGSTETGFFPSGQVVTAFHSWNVPAGSSRTYNVRALSADSKYLFCPYPYWSNPLVVTITGPSILAQKLSPEVEGNEAIYVQTEDLEFIDTQTNETDSVDTQTGKDEFIDAQINETDSVDAQTNETDSVDAQTNETDSVDAQTNETDSVNTQIEEADSVDAQTNETDSIDTQMEVANLTKLRSPSS